MKNLLILGFLVTVLAADSASAQVIWWPELFGSCGAPCVVAMNQELVWAIGQPSVIWGQGPTQSAPYPGQTEEQYQIVCRDKSKKYKALRALSGGLAGFGFGGLATGNRRGAIYGGMSGAGMALWGASNEKECYLVPLSELQQPPRPSPRRRR